MTNPMKAPRFIAPWTAPFHVTMDGIKDSRGCWIASAANNKLAHELVELMNYAAKAAEMEKSLRAFVSACGGNPPDWLLEEFAAAESIICEIDGIT